VFNRALASYSLLYPSFRERVTFRSSMQLDFYGRDHLLPSYCKGLQRRTAKKDCKGIFGATSHDSFSLPLDLVCVARYVKQKCCEKNDGVHLVHFNDLRNKTAKNNGRLTTRRRRRDAPPSLLPLLSTHTLFPLFFKTMGRGGRARGQT
jgi:hypothetical protein